jgi:hypothetical protein
VFCVDEEEALQLQGKPSGAWRGQRASLVVEEHLPCSAYPELESLPCSAYPELESLPCSAYPAALTLQRLPCSAYPELESLPCSAYPAALTLQHLPCSARGNHQVQVDDTNNFSCLWLNLLWVWHVTGYRYGYCMAEQSIACNRPTALGWAARLIHSPCSGGSTVTG